MKKTLAAFDSCHNNERKEKCSLLCNVIMSLAQSHVSMCMSIYLLNKHQVHNPWFLSRYHNLNLMHTDIQVCVSNEDWLG